MGTQLGDRNDTPARGLRRRRRADLAVYRLDGEWWLGDWRGLRHPWGAPATTSGAGDYDGDGKTDVAVPALAGVGTVGGSG